MAQTTRISKLNSNFNSRRTTQLHVISFFVAILMTLSSFIASIEAYTPASNPTFRKRTARFVNIPSFSLGSSDPVASNTSPQPWTFQGHACYAQVTRPWNTKFPFFEVLGSTKKPEIVLIHGFGCSSYYWRETIKALTTEGYTVHALDLLGQGKSAKPGRDQGIEYSINLWARLVEDYTQQFIPNDTNVVLMGNSLGSVVALSAATGDHAAASVAPTDGSVPTLPSRIQGIGMFNCGVGMNSRNLLKDPNLNIVQRVLFTFLFDTLDRLIFDNIPLLTYVLKYVVTRDILRNALVGLYQCSPDPASRVDDALVDSFYFPAKDTGSVDALNQIYTNDAGKTPMQLQQDHMELMNNLPIHLVWGEDDQVTPIGGPVGQFYLDLVKDPAVPMSISTVKAGHIPFDDIPECNQFMVQWLNNVVLAYGPKGEKPKITTLQWPFARSSR
jgi:pimeloyl-ACP methyl ester carboxylesterase